MNQNLHIHLCNRNYFLGCGANSVGDTQEQNKDGWRNTQIASFTWLYSTVFQRDHLGLWTILSLDPFGQKQHLGHLSIFYLSEIFLDPLDLFHSLTQVFCHGKVSQGNNMATSCVWKWDDKWKWDQKGATLLLFRWPR